MVWKKSAPLSVVSPDVRRVLEVVEGPRTTAAQTLNPSDKAAVNYFIGMTVCKLLASTLLNAPRMLHLDVFRPQLDVQLSAQSRPTWTVCVVGRQKRGPDPQK